MRKDEYDKLGTELCVDYIYAQIESVLVKLFVKEKATEDIIRNSLSQAKEGSKMLMRFKEKKSAKCIAAIFLRLLDNRKYFPLLCVTDLDNKVILNADWLEVIDLLEKFN